MTGDGGGEVAGGGVAALIAAGEVAQEVAEGVVRAGLIAQQGAQHVEDERAFAVDVRGVGGRQLARARPPAEADRAGAVPLGAVPQVEHGVRELAEAARDRAGELVGVGAHDVAVDLRAMIDLRLDVQQGRVLGERLPQPGVAVGRRAHPMPPPLVRHLVGAEQLAGPRTVLGDAARAELQEAVERLAVEALDGGHQEGRAGERLREEVAEEAHARRHVARQLLVLAVRAEPHPRAEADHLGDPGLGEPRLVIALADVPGEGEGHHLDRVVDLPDGDGVVAVLPLGGLPPHRPHLLLVGRGDLEPRRVQVAQEGLVVLGGGVPVAAGDVVGELDLVLDVEPPRLTRLERLVEED